MVTGKELGKALEADEASWGGQGAPLLNAEELKYFVDAFTRTGFTGGLNIGRPWAPRS